MSEAPPTDKPGSDPLDRVDEAIAASRWVDAMALADAALALDPDDAEMHHARGVSLRGLERFDEAVDEFLAATRLQPDLADAWLDAAETCLEDAGDAVMALEVLGRARKRMAGTPEAIELDLLRGMALSRLEDFSGALAALDAAAELDPAHPDVATERGAVLIELLRVEEAEAALRSAITADAANARSLSLLAFLLDYSGRRDEAAELFARAGVADAALPASPPRLDEKEFDTALDEAVSTIPAPFAERLANVEISVENYATKEFCRRHDCSPMTLGVYVGTPVPLRQESTEAGSLPDRIVLFQRAIENSCADRAELIAEIAVTLQHEVGHLLGFSEEELHERGFA